MIDETHDPAARSWVESANGHPDFPVQNLPLGVFSPPGGGPRIGCAIGEAVLDLAAAVPAMAALQEPALNALFARPPAERRALRRAVFSLLTKPGAKAQFAPHLHAAADCQPHLPARIGDYTDFYAGIHHATTIGALFRPDAPLLPNYKHVPIGYHGRASSVRPSGASVVRPNGQTKAPDAEAPSFGPSRRLDYELELGVWVGPGNAPGRPIPIAEAGSHIAGLCLLNDWSARDIQAWEYQPLGPFLAKSFATTISPWVVTVEALAPFRIPQPPRPAGDPRPLDYLWDEADQAGGAFALTLEVSLSTAGMRKAALPAQRLSRAAASHMYWTVAQLLTHHASNGCDLRPGDLLGSGTISAPAREGFGSLMEITSAGREPLALPGGETRAFLEDGDEVIFEGRAEAPGRVSIGFGRCSGAVVAA